MGLLSHEIKIRDPENSQAGGESTLYHLLRQETHPKLARTFTRSLEPTGLRRFGVNFEKQSRCGHIDAASSWQGSVRLEQWPQLG